MTMYKFKKQHGFSLIEVMIAVLVLAIGILAVSKLQTSLLRSGSNANQKSVAASIVNRKIDDLSRFINLSSTTNWSTLSVDADNVIISPLSLAYDHILSNRGGRIKPGPISSGNMSYDLSWDVVDYYYADSGLTAPAVTAFPAFKHVHVVASWNGVGDNTNNVVSFDTAIYRYDPSLTTVSNSTGTGNNGPTDKTDENADLSGGLSIGEGKTLIGGQVAPNISRAGAGVVTAFESLVFNTSTNSIQRRDRFKTVGCVCKKVNPDVTEHLVGYTSWDNTVKAITDLSAEETYTTEYTELKENQLGDNDQPFECDLCCRDGKTEVAVSSSVAYKVCRLKYISGGFKVFPDWKLIGFNIIPESFFNTSTNSAIYSTYVTSLIRVTADVEATQGASYYLNSYSTIDNSFATYAASEILAGGHSTLTNNSTIQLQVKAIYMDEIPDGVYEGATYTATNVPIDRIPFFDVDLARLAGWTPDEDNQTFTATYTGNGVVLNDWAPGQHDDIPNGTGQACKSSNISAGPNCVSNQRLTDGDEDSYSRGLFYSYATPSTTVVRSQIFDGSNGWVDREVNTETLNTTSISIIVSP